MAIAEAYLSSFRPVDAVPGFEGVLSTSGMNALGLIPAANAKLGAELASAALKEIGQNERLRQNIEAIERENALRRKTDRRAGALRMAGTLFGSSLGGGTADAGVDAGDPLALIERLSQFHTNQSTARAGQSIRSNAYLKRLLEQGAA